MNIRKINLFVCQFFAVTWVVIGFLYGEPVAIVSANAFVAASLVLGGMRT